MLSSHQAHGIKPHRHVACAAASKRKQNSKSPWQSGKAGTDSAGSSQAAAKLSDAARAAAKRAAQFSKQRQQRSFSLAQQEQLQQQQQQDVAPYSFNDSSSSSSRGSVVKALQAQTAAAAAALAPAAAADPGQYSDLQPYIEVVTEHLTQQGSLSSSSKKDGSSDSSGSSKKASSDSSSGRGRGAKKAAARGLLEAHTAVFQAALDLELQQEWREAEERLKSWPQSQLAAEGVALFGLAAAPDGAVARDVVLRFFVPEKPLPFHSFSQGDILLVSQGDPLGDSHEAVVLDFSGRWIRLAMNPTAAAAVAEAAGGWRSGSSGASSGSRRWRSIWRLDLFANTVSHERCSEALHRFAAAATQQQQGVGGGLDRQGLLSGLLTQGQLQQQELLCRMLAGVLPQGTPLEAVASQTPPWVRTPQGRERLAAARAFVKTLVQEKQLNPSQAAAITAALSRNVTLVQGPPGTGKTTTLLHFCEACLSVLPPSGGRLLAVAASNVAVDQLVGGLLARGVKVVRIGQPAKVTPALRSVTLEALAAATAPGQAAAKLRQQLLTAAAANRAANRPSNSSSSRGASSSSGKGRGWGGRGRDSSVGAAAGGMWEQMVALEAAAAAEVLSKVQVVAATCVGAGDPVLQERFFDVAVLDEATQAPEPAALVAVAQKVQALVMVGDPQQLPPTVRCPEAQQLGLGFSLFERVQAMGLKPLLLDTQYRMHPKLAEFPSSAFYQGLLRSWPKPSDRPLPPGLPWPNPQVPVLFIQVKGQESRTAASFSISRQQESLDSADEDSSSSSSSGRNRSSSGSNGSSSNGTSSSSSGGGHSYYNTAEATVVVECVQRLLAAGMSASDLCVITPYSGQVRSIQRLLAGEGDSGRQQQQQQQHNQQQQQRRAPAAGQAPRSQVLEGLEVKSVDGFQGREKEVVVFSAVRSNSSRRVGFLADLRRLNVALTRAKRGLVIVGDAATLSGDRVWSSWLAWARKHGVCVDGL